MTGSLGQIGTLDFRRVASTAGGGQEDKSGMITGECWNFQEHMTHPFLSPFPSLFLSLSFHFSLSPSSSHPLTCIYLLLLLSSPHHSFQPLSLSLNPPSLQDGLWWGEGRAGGRGSQSHAETRHGHLNQLTLENSHDIHMVLTWYSHDSHMIKYLFLTLTKLMQ